MARIATGDVIIKEPTAKDHPLPQDSSPGATVPPGKSNDDVIRDAIDTSLPKAVDFTDYLTWAPQQLPQLRNNVLAASGVNTTNFSRDIKTDADAVDQAEKALNTKQVAARPQPVPVSPLPGVSNDPACQSAFDASDLAIRGRKSVVKKRYYVPIIFPEAIYGQNQMWRFGQKVEYQQEWRHEGFTLGPLVSSISLLPNEELVIEVSSWQKTKQEIEQITDQTRREQHEREQQRTDEQSVTNEAAATEGWQVSATGSVSYPGASASISGSYSGTVSQRTENAERHVMQATSKASSELSLRRAVKITQQAEAGSENRTTRKIKNPNACHTVTFNFFQVVKLIDVQLRLINDALTIMYPSLFPAADAQGNPVPVPFGAIEAFNSPANFLTQFFDVDRDISTEIHGWALRVRSDPYRDPGAALQQITEALIVAFKYLLKMDPAKNQQPIARLVASYATHTKLMRDRNAAGYGAGKGRSEEIMTPGIYADSLLGQCTACEDYVEASRYIDAVKRQADIDLENTELQRRKKRIEAGDYTPFEAPAPVPGS